MFPPTKTRPNTVQLLKINIDFISSLHQEKQSYPIPHVKTVPRDPPYPESPCHFGPGTFQTQEVSYPEPLEIHNHHCGLYEPAQSTSCPDKEPRPCCASQRPQLVAVRSTQSAAAPAGSFAFPDQAH